MQFIYSYSTENSVSGIDYGATALIGCDNSKVWLIILFNPYLNNYKIFHLHSSFLYKVLWVLRSKGWQEELLF